jgi:transcriptional regulator with XRE-family HTH domain
MNSSSIDAPSLARRLKLLRIAKGIAPADLARTIGVTRSTWGDYEAGRARPSIDVIAQLRRWCGVRSEWILFGEMEDQMPSELMRDIRKAAVQSAIRYSRNGTNHNGDA